MIYRRACMALGNSGVKRGFHPDQGKLSIADVKSMDLPEDLIDSFFSKAMSI